MQHQKLQIFFSINDTGNLFINALGINKRVTATDNKNVDTNNKAADNPIIKLHTARIANPTIPNTPNAHTK